MIDWQDQLNNLDQKGLLRRLRTVTSDQGAYVEIDGQEFYSSVQTTILV